MIAPPAPPSRTYGDGMTDPTRWHAFRPRAGDIVVTTPPKSGTTWTQSILALLISGDPEVDAETSMKSPWIDFRMREVDEVMARLEAQTHRRQVKSHTPLDGLLIWHELRYITVYRHPIDAHFSFLRHAANMDETISRQVNPPEFFSDDPSVSFRVFLEQDHSDTASLSNIVAHYKATRALEPSDNLLRLHYADMLRDLPEAFDRIIAHCGFAPDPEVLPKLIEAARFDNMKANAHRFTPSAGQGFWKEDAGFFDSATSNKWQGKLTQEDLAAYDKRMAELLDPAERAWLENGSGEGVS